MDRGFKEGNNNEVHLPEDDPKVFTTILHVLYHDKLPPRLTVEFLTFSDDSVNNMFAAYISADKYCFEELQNEIVSLFAEACKRKVFRALHISTLTKAGLVDSKLRSLLLQNVASELAEFGYDVCFEGDPTVGDLVQGGGIDSRDILKTSIALALTAHLKHPGLIEDVCDLYHIHNTTKQCEKAKKYETAKKEAKK